MHDSTVPDPVLQTLCDLSKQLLLARIIFQTTRVLPMDGIISDDSVKTVVIGCRGHRWMILSTGIRMLRNDRGRDLGESGHCPAFDPG
ncbi:MAG TPA: hypothetical protein DC058_18505 [Planctomycetaceae bacterium]|nr:hypothetical protein [Planctomycetaceae bacterium]HBC63191.1 hypothetical protein [Planctomycetaceae bacterium]